MRISMKELPEEVRQLLSYGWGTCVIYDQGWGGFRLRYEYLCQELAKYGIPAPTAVYFPEDSESSRYDSGMDDVFIECGIRTIIRPTENARENMVSDPTAALWHIGSRPWYYTAAPADLELLGRTDGGNICFTMKVTDKWKTNILDSQIDQFVAAMESWKANNWLYDDDPLEEYDRVGPTPAMYVDPNDEETARQVLHEGYLASLTPEQLLMLPRFRSVSLDTALELHASAAVNRPLLEQEREEKRAELEKQIADLEAEIGEVYRTFDIVPEEKRTEA